jgi:hypothetical protein
VACKSSPPAWLQKNAQIGRSSSSWLAACKLSCSAWLAPCAGRWHENPMVTSLVPAHHCPRSCHSPPNISSFLSPPSLLLLVTPRLRRR